MSAGSLTLGGNLSIAIGPLGRNGEATGSLNTSGKMAAMLVYLGTFRELSNAEMYHNNTGTATPRPVDSSVVSLSKAQLSWSVKTPTPSHTDLM